MNYLEDLKKEMFKITVGDNGVCMGQYDPSDEWYESGDTIEDIVEKMNIIYYYGDKGRWKEFKLEKIEILYYNGSIYDHKHISQYNPYNKEDNLKKEYEEYWILWKSDKYKNIRDEMIESDRIKDEKKKELKRIKEEEKKLEQELKQYLELKQKYENK